MITLARLLHRSAGRSPVTLSPAFSSVTVCEECGQACTSACRALARADRERTALLGLGLPR